MKTVSGVIVAFETQMERINPDNVVGQTHPCRGGETLPQKIVNQTFSPRYNQTPLKIIPVKSVLLFFQVMKLSSLCNI